MVASSVLSYPVPAAPVVAKQFSWGGASATAIVVDSPAQTQPNIPFWVTGSFTGTPLSFNYQIDAGSTQICQSLGFDQFGNFSFFIPGGLAAGTHTVTVIDSINSGVHGTSGNFVISTYDPTQLASATCIWDHDPNDRTLTTVNGYVGGIGLVNQIKNRLNQRQYLTAQNGAPPAQPVGLQRSTGSDGTRTLLQMKVRTTSPLSTFDPTTNCFAGGYGLVNNNPVASIITALRNLGPGNTAVLSSFTAIRFDTTLGATFFAGLLGIAIPSTPNQPFIQITPRYNPSTPEVGGQWVDNNGVSTDAALSAVPSTGWYVLSISIKGGTMFVSQNQSAVTGSHAMGTGLVSNINDLSLGGDGGTNATLNGAPYPYFGRTMMFIGGSGITGGDLTSTITACGNSIGLSI